MIITIDINEEKAELFERFIKSGENSLFQVVQMMQVSNVQQITPVELPKLEPFVYRKTVWEKYNDKRDDSY